MNLLLPRDESTSILGSPQQEDIWRELQHGTAHVLVDARAGVGKTTAIVEGAVRVPKALKVGIVAFNKHIERELNERLQLRGEIHARALTLHKLGFAAVRQAFPTVCFMDDKLQAIVRTYTRNRSAFAFLTKLVRLCKCRMDDGTEPATLDDLVERHNIELNELNDSHKPALFAQVPKILRDCLNDNAAVDYDDMIWFPVVLGLRVEQFDLLLIDEGQDVNQSQQELVFMACRRGRIAVVGDRFQGIYGFRGAATDAIESFQERLASSTRGCVVLPLTVTRRCPKSHVGLVNSLVPDIEALEDAPEGEIEQVGDNHAVNLMKPGDLGLCRVNRCLASVAYRLLGRDIKVVIQGRDFGNDLIAFVDRLKCSDLPDLLKRMMDLHEQEYAKLRSLGDKGAARMEILGDRICCVIELSEGLSTVEALRQRIRQIFDDVNGDGSSRNAVLLGTVHRTKGLERNTVFVLAPELIPHPLAKLDWEIPQERNVAYIAGTRAKFQHGRHSGKLIFAGSIPKIYQPSRETASGRARTEKCRSRVGDGPSNGAGHIDAG